MSRIVSYNGCAVKLPKGLKLADCIRVTVYYATVELNDFVDIINKYPLDWAEDITNGDRGVIIGKWTAFVRSDSTLVQEIALIYNRLHQSDIWKYFYTDEAAKHLD